MTDLTKTVDDLGRLKAKIADLTARKKDLEFELIDSGETSIEGKLFRVTISDYFASKIDWKGIAAKLKASKRLISANTSESEVTRVSVYARKAATRKAA
jgi:hypothetical protein